MWLRPLPLRRDSSTWLLATLTTGTVVAAILGISGSESRARRVGGRHCGSPTLRPVPGSWCGGIDADDHGQLFVAIAVPLAALGILQAAPSELVAIGWAAMAAGLCWLAVHWRHRYAAVEGVVMTALAGAWVAYAIYPLAELTRPPFPPDGAGEFPTPVGLAIIATLMAIIAAAGRWAMPSRLGRSSLVAMSVLLVAYVLPFETDGLVLLALWVALAVGAAMVAIRWFTGALRRTAMPSDPSLVAGMVVGVAALVWSLVGFGIAHGIVDVLGPRGLERAMASLIPITGVVVLVAWLRPRWWRGATAAIALLLATAAVWLQAGAARFVIGGTGTGALDGSLVVLVGWAALALLALVLDERPRMRLSMHRDLVADPVGHPLALMALVPAVAELGLLARRFLAGGVGAPPPSTPFADERTLATAIVITFVLLAAAAAHTRLVRTVLLGVAAVLLAVLLPMELPMALAVTGWCLLAVVSVLVAGGRGDIEVRGAWLLASGLLLCAIGATALLLAPPDRLFLEATRTAPTSGPPNAATLALAAIAAALAAAAVIIGPDRRSAWLWLGVGATLTWLLSIGIADTFAMRVAGGADLGETAKQEQVALSMAWAALGLATMLYGLIRDITLARQAGLVLLAIATIKVFAYDLATLDIAYRMLSLIGLGALLLLSAYAWAHGRHHGGPEAMSR